MKTLLYLFTFIVISNLSYGQDFPSPTNFDIQFCYAWPDTCGPGYDPGDTVYYYSFDAPDVSGIESELVGYNLYFEEDFMVFFTTTTYEDVTYGEGDYYVTAVYINPSGESLPSNVVHGDGAALSIGDYNKLNNIIIYPNPLPVNEQLTIESNSEIINISAYDILGNKIFNTTKNKTKFSANKRGIYFLKIETENGISIKKIILE
ncbi:T9SS type A sorting domain-containing protein [Aequorivita lipolytica]|uniref:T9SS type A sorting domain-containing protein n=1 Tax=Aequorivita lipolytica TaxID=153267 RepID=A0A5C6YP20_9FLAO|nr:T9SS type A sorting domain-containing protein [Aequorivita lipolytica]TXD69103.1 T9SS type A sorting domain-containing protein [Aequorivita lipolytica]SRX51324.1 hypothetical protein AEQU2_01804 [Aequorivita lipolytica]